ncbi:hypothetical protein TWF481_006873 [Arthrobotrys musiformis]|uniref:Putative zinc-finger domain-containing protein n=1 Tax=Arthrobotrys musiformis TaxID=47236 RepID=A0AAV9WAP4_9PEZI
MSSTCPEVPSFAGIRHGPTAGRRAMPARRAMPKPRQTSTSAASAAPKTPVTPVTPITPGGDSSKPSLTISVPLASAPSQRDEGPEEGEISDEEDDHYSPREATTPVLMNATLDQTSLQANHIHAAMAASFQAPLINTLSSITNLNDQSLIKKQQPNINAPSRPVQETNPKLMPMPELRKAAQSAVMYLSCSARMSFDQIMAEGVEHSVLAGIYNQLKLPIPDSSKNVPTTVLPKNTTPSEVLNGPKATVPTPTVPKPEINTTSTALPSSLPPKPPSSTPASNNAPSVVSRFNQSIPGLNLVQSTPNQIVSPPLPTPQSGVVQETSQTSQPSTLRSRKRPVAADFDIETKPALPNTKQPRFGNRQRLEASHLIFDVSDNEEEEEKQKALHVTPQTVGPSRPDSTNPEKNENLGESIRLKELAIEDLRQLIANKTRKRKLVSNGEAGSGPPSQPTTPLPATPSTDLLSAKEASLERVEEFLHQTLDQISAGSVQPAAVEAAVELATAELMEAEAKITSLNVDVPADTPASISSPEKLPTPSADDSDAKDNVTMTDSSELQADDKSFETSPIDLDSEDDDADALGSPMDLSDLDTTSEGSDQDSSDSESDLGAEDSEPNDTSEQVSSDDSADVEMHGTSGDESPASDSASSPAQETPDDDIYDPENRKSTLGEVSIPPATTEIPRIQLPLPIGVSDPRQPTATSTNGQPKTPGFKEYQSQLSGFKSFRYHPGYSKLVSQGYKSLTYSHHIDSELPICDFETRGGACNDPQCRWQHFRQMALPGAFYQVCEENTTTVISHHPDSS